MAHMIWVFQIDVSNLFLIGLFFKSVISLGSFLVAELYSCSQQNDSIWLLALKIQSFGKSTVWKEYPCGKSIRFIVRKYLEYQIISSESSSELVVNNIKYTSDLVLCLSIQRVTSEMHLEQPMSRYCSFVSLLLQYERVMDVAVSAIFF